VAGGKELVLGRLRFYGRGSGRLRRHTHWFAVLLFLPAASTGLARGADEGEGLSLARAIELALAHQPAVAAARDQAEASTQDARARAALLWPQLGARAGDLFSSGDGGVVDFAAADGPREIVGQLVVSQWILNRSVREDVVASRAEVAFARFRTLATRLEVAEMVAQAYVALESQRAAVDVWQAAEQVAQKTLDATKQGLDAGTRARIDLLRAQLSVSRARQGLDVARAEETSTTRLLALMTGLETLPPLEAATPPLPGLELPRLEELEAEAVRNQPSLAMLRVQHEREAALLAAARGERLPTVGAEAAVGWDTLDLPWRVGPGWSAGVFLTVPVFTSGDIRARVAAARLRTEAAEKTYEQGRLELEESLARALGEAASALASVRSDEKIVPDKAEIARISEEGYRAGQLSSLDLFLAEQELVQSRLSLAESAARLRLALARIELLTGKLPGGGGA
jgi:outer membrane protein TolC